ncbi:REL3 protein, partial [Amia calva]|nr:REL3 protein [Amia calva]
MRAVILPVLLLLALSAIAQVQGEVKVVKLCGREFIRAVIYTCGGSRWRRVPSERELAGESVAGGREGREEREEREEREVEGSPGVHIYCSASVTWPLGSQNCIYSLQLFFWQLFFWLFLGGSLSSFLLFLLVVCIVDGPKPKPGYRTQHS